MVMQDLFFLNALKLKIIWFLVGVAIVSTWFVQFIFDFYIPESSIKLHHIYNGLAKTTIRHLYSNDKYFLYLLLIVTNFFHTYIIYKCIQFVISYFCTNLFVNHFFVNSLYLYYYLLIVLWFVSFGSKTNYETENMFNLNTQVGHWAAYTWL